MILFNSFWQTNNVIAHFFIMNFRNYRQTCEQIQGLDLSAWSANGDYDFSTEHEEHFPDPTTTTAAPILEDIGLDSTVIKLAIEKAKKNLDERKRFEYEAWLARK